MSDNQKSSLETIWGTSAEIPPDNDGTHNEEANPQPIELQSQPQESHETDCRDCRLKNIWKKHVGNMKDTCMPYHAVVVLLLSWHPDDDDLDVEEEVDQLQLLFRDTFKYETVRHTLKKNPRTTAQSQVNKYLADFVYDFDDANTLLIVYVAGHGDASFRDVHPVELHLSGTTNIELDDGLHLNTVNWSATTNAFEHTKSDVLIILDVCGTDVIGNNFKSELSHHNFECLGPRGLTRKPGDRSFTKALMESLKELNKSEKCFPTQLLLEKIKNYPGDLGGRHDPVLMAKELACSRRIVLAPLRAQKDDKNEDHREASSDRRDDVKEGIDLRLIFSKHVNEKMVQDLAVGMKRLLIEGDYKACNIVLAGVHCVEHEHA